MVSNGRLPASALTPVQYGLSLPHRAANQWLALQKAAKDRHGVELRLTYSSTWPTPPKEIGGLGAYRTFECQQWMWDHRNDGGKRRQCAAPGNSVHGTVPGCIDIYNHTVLKRATLVALASEFGWIANTVANEPWHFKYNGTTTSGGGWEPLPVPEQETGDEIMYGLITVPDANLQYVQGIDGRREGIQNEHHRDLLQGYAKARTNGEFFTMYWGDMEVINWYLSRVNADLSDPEVIKKLDAIAAQIEDLDGNGIPDAVPQSYTITLTGEATPKV